MNRRDVFNRLFTAGFDYEFYRTRSERHEARMEQAYEASQSYINQLPKEELARANVPMKVLCIAENWCSDCGNGVPAVASLAEVMDNWEFAIAPRDDFEQEVGDYYSTAGRKKIPVVIFADGDGDEISRWVERPMLSYLKLSELRDRKLPKEEYIQEYRTHPQFRPPKVAHDVIDEVLAVATKAATMIKILPKKK